VLLRLAAVVSPNFLCYLLPSQWADQPARDHGAHAGGEAGEDDHGDVDENKNFSMSSTFQGKA
jgi:hypothetical protein